MKTKRVKPSQQKMVKQKVQVDAEDANELANLRGVVQRLEQKRAVARKRLEAAQDAFESSEDALNSSVAGYNREVHWIRKSYKIPDELDFQFEQKNEDGKVVFYATWQEPEADVPAEVQD